jgi:hypothetical protein
MACSFCADLSVAARMESPRELLDIDAEQDCDNEPLTARR